MKMPEGWIALAENRGSILMALKLMKEMAEALEYHHEQLGDFPSSSPGYQALLKFREWK